MHAQRGRRAGARALPGARPRARLSEHLDRGRVAGRRRLRRALACTPRQGRHARRAPDRARRARAAARGGQHLAAHRGGHHRALAERGRADLVGLRAGRLLHAARLLQRFSADRRERASGHGRARAHRLRGAYGPRAADRAVSRADGQRQEPRGAEARSRAARLGARAGGGRAADRAHVRPRGGRRAAGGA